MSGSAHDGEDFAEYLAEISPRGRTMLLPALLEAQRRFGFVSQETGSQIASSLDAPLADISGVIEFYSMLHSTPLKGTSIRICGSPTCSALGAQDLLRETRHQLNGGEADGAYFIEEVQCIGLCENAPAALVEDRPVGRATPIRIQSAADDFSTPIYGPERVLTGRCGTAEPDDIDAYLASGGFQGLQNALHTSPEAVRETVKESGLIGRGGAAFRTHVKWDGAAAAPGDSKYIVCNADESEPGTFKDRALLEGDPLAVLEGMIIAGFAIGTEKGFIYIRGEYGRARGIFQRAMAAARQRGCLGDDILGSGFRFEVEIRSGAGAYICGEETALFESIEGKRGFPRLKPPFPTTHGLYHQPTVINNVETLAQVSLILRIGAQAYRAYGSQSSVGPWLFSLSGEVERPGLYEIAHPMTLEELVFDLGGGMLDGRPLAAVLLGGAAGKFIPPSGLDVRLTHEDARAAGLALGSGAVMVFSQETDLRQVLAALGHFFAHESCGKCYPCQLGTQRQLEILDRVLEGAPLPGDVERLSDVGWTMTDASLCGLGQTAASAVMSAMEHWPELFEV